MEQKKQLFTSKNILVAVAGGTASGKTTFSKKIMKEISEYSVILLSLDNYYKDFSYLTFEQREKINFDNPDNFDVPLLKKHLTMLRNNESIEQFIYDFSIHLRSKKTIVVKPAKIIIIEGLFLLHIEEIRDLFNIKLYIETDDDLRFIRRLERDIKERNRTKNYVVNQYLETVKPMHDLIVKPSSRYADLIIPYYDGNKVAMKILLASFTYLLNNKKNKL